MPLFRRSLWPHDHRDELVAGALVGAVVVVLGYASGIGAPAASSDATAAPPPAVTSPSPPGEAATPSETPGDIPGGAAGGAAGAGALPVTGVYYPGGTDHTGHTGTSGGTGHTGHGGSPTPSAPTSPPSSGPSAPGTTPPGDDATCEDGEVRLAGPLLTGLTEPVFGLLNPTAEASPAPQPSPCVGLAPLPSLLGGVSPSPEATP
ncbi:hypothetical protein [Streptomyces cyaneus]|uniref:hypothetical protein n=1 Tax=Streptomyces cyaneus TaxID=1904 RepID=UPI000FF89CAF|nr:hypothetical protein [Streptomyces cyaneus]